MGWYKLVERNDWDYITVHIGGPVTGGRFGTNMALEDCPPALGPGKYRVRFKDGTIKTLQVKMREYSEQTHDMGHVYTTHGEKPYFLVPFHGKLVEVYAPKLGVEVER